MINQQKSFDLDQGQALALAAIGQFKDAARVQRSMIAELEHAQRVDLVRVLRPNLALYEHDKPCLVPWQDDDPVFSPVPGGMGVTAAALAPIMTGDQSGGPKF